MGRIAGGGQIFVLSRCADGIVCVLVPSLAYSLFLVSHLTIVATQCEEPFGRSMPTVLPPDMVVVDPQLPVPILTQRSSNVVSG